MTTSKKPAEKKQPAKAKDEAADLEPIPRKTKLEKLTKDELIALAQERGIDTTGLLTLELRAKLAE